MSMSLDACEPTVTQTHNEVEIENKDPFVVTPPRKYSEKTQTTTPATPRSKANTPLHKRFLEEVIMTPGTPSTPPRTPSRSPKGGSKEDARLEVGQNGFYFSMEIPERKIVGSRPTSRTATPSPEKNSGTKDAGRLTPSRLMPSRFVNGRTTPGRLTPSPKKEVKSEVKGISSGGGRVRDILRKNLFGAPARKATTPDCGETKKESDGRMNPAKHDKGELQTNDGSDRESTVGGAAIEQAAAHSSAQKPDVSAQLRPQPPSTLAPPTSQKADLSPVRQQAPKKMPLTPTSLTNAAPPILRQKAPVASTPSNIGHLMANHSNKGAKVQTLPATGGLESMPTPLRKMKEKLGLMSPHVVRKDMNYGHEPKESMMEADTTIPQLSAQAINDSTTVNDAFLMSVQAHILPLHVANGAAGGYTARKEANVTRLLPSPITTSSPITSSCPNTATPSTSSPLTPSRPGLSSRSKSFGTPARLRSSMQEDMFKVQESLRRSLGQEAFQKTASRPATPMSPSTETCRSSTSATNYNKSSVEKVTRPKSLVASSQSTAETAAQAVARRPLNPAARKPRPKSMIVGSAKILETIASQVDSPRERAKLRSTAAVPTNQRSKSTLSRPGPASSAPRAPKPATTTQKPEKPALSQPTVRTTKSATLRVAALPKRAALPTARPTSPRKQRLVSAKVIADRVASWNREDGQSNVPKPVSKAAPIPTRSKSVKALNRPAASQPTKRTKTPEPKQPLPTSDTTQSFTPPGTPTRLPMSPSKTRLVAPAPAPAPRPRPINPRKPLPPSAAAHLRTPLPARTPASKRHTWVEGAGDSNALRTPSREVASALDRAIDAKIEEDRRRVRAGWI